MLRLLADEHVHGGLVHGIRLRQPDIITVQEAGLSGKSDPELLTWAAANGRIMISEDRKTLIRQARLRIAGGLPMPGIFILRKGLTFGQMIDEILIVANCNEPAEWESRIEHLPL